MSKHATDPLIGATVRVRANATNIHGDPHPHAGQTGSVISRTPNGRQYMLSIGDSLINLQQESFDPLPQGAPAYNAGTRMCMVDLSLITESATNPRKFFDPARLQELADSIAATGVHQPVLLRPLPGSSTGYELVAGARRLRASKMAQQTEIPAMIRDLSNEQAMEIQVIENLQREDVRPLEEADGYAQLMQMGHADADSVAAKIGKSRSYVYARLKLLDLSADCKTALGEGKIDASRALRIARIPDAKLQAKALAEASRVNWRGDPAVGVREFEKWLQQNVMLRIDSAPFSITAIDLVDNAGSCKECRSRTGASPELFTDVGDQNLCTEPACYAAKSKAHDDRLRAKAEEQGLRVIDGKNAKSIVNTYSGKIKGYTRLDTRYADAGDASMRDLLGDDGPQRVLIVHPETKELIEVVPTDEAEAVLVQRGVLKTSQAKIDLDERIDQLKHEASMRQERATTKATIAAFMRAAHLHESPASALADADLLREWLKSAVTDLDADDMLAVAGLEPIEDEDYTDAGERALARIDRATDTEVRAFMLAWFVSWHAYELGRKEGHPLRQAIARALGVDVEAVQAEAVAEEQAKLAESIANLRAAAQAQAEKAAAPKTISTPRPAAQPSATRAKGKAKTTKAEASAKIAAALTAMEKEQNQAPAAQGNETPTDPVGRSASAAPHGHGGAGAKAKGKPDQAPAAPGNETLPDPDGRAVGAAPNGKVSADASNRAQAPAYQLPMTAIDVGLPVRITPTATGKLQAPWIDHEGVVAGKVGDRAWTVDITFPKRSRKGIVFDASELEVLA